MEKESLNKKNSESIFVLPILDKYLLYSPLQGISALLNSEAVHQLKKGIMSLNNNSVNSELNKLISSLQVTTFKNPDKTGDLDPHFLGIIPSRRCNMSCTYCDFKANQSSEKIIDPDIMISAIDYYAELIKKKNKKLLNIQFFGGEPFVEQEIIDIAVHHARFIASKKGLIPYFEVLSNGYLNTKQRVFIKDYFDRIIISFDGFKKYHDKTRPLNSRQSSFDTVVKSIKYLSGKNIELAIRCCITSNSVDEMEKMAEWFCAEFNPDIVNFETLTQNNETEKLKLYAPDPYIFAKKCIKSWRILRNNNVEPAYASVSLDKVQTTSCPVGKDTLIVHPDGMIASCYLLKNDWEKKNIDLSVGKISKDLPINIDLKKINKLRNPVYSKSVCDNCFCRYGCAGNCHVNHSSPDSIDKIADFCVHTRIITACKILEDMGLPSISDELLFKNNASKKLALQKSDKILHFNE